MRGSSCSLRAEPYEAGSSCLTSARTPGLRKGGCGCFAPSRAQVEPIFLLYDGRLERPDGESVLDVELEGVRSRLWRVAAEPPEALADAQLLIADGHHRYETTLAYHAEGGSEESAWLLAAIVPTEQEGLTIFPTHRIAERLGRAADERPFDGRAAERPLRGRHLPEERNHLRSGRAWRARHGARRPARAGGSHATRRTRRRRRPPSTPGRPRPRSSSARRASSSSASSRSGARRCRRRARTSIPSYPAACSSTRCEPLDDTASRPAKPVFRGACRRSREDPAPLGARPYSNTVLRASGLDPL